MYAHGLLSPEITTKTGFVDPRRQSHGYHVENSLRPYERKEILQWNLHLNFPTDRMKSVLHGELIQRKIGKPDHKKHRATLIVCQRVQDVCVNVNVKRNITAAMNNARKLE
jgi:hypothetical protein